MDPFTLSLIAGGGVGLLQGLFGGQEKNPFERFANPNDSFYTGAAKNYYNNLNRSLSALTPGKATLLSMQRAGGGGYGGSTYVAGKQAENMLAKVRDTAGTQSQQFQNNLFRQGMNLYGQGGLAQFEANKGGILDSLGKILGSGLGYLAGMPGSPESLGNGFDIPTGHKGFGGQINSPYANYNPLWE